MQKRDTVDVFRRRLTELIDASGETRSRFAARAGLDRSTLSQLLSPDTVRLPRAETIARIAQRHQASVDWLLGLSEAPQVTADIVSQPLVAQGADDPASELLRRWHEEARGAKVRYVPATLPDQVKTGAVIHYENARLSKAEAEAMAATARERIDHLRLSASEIEVCSPRQSLEMFARGEGAWRHLPARDRRRQLEHMAGEVDRLYPSYRWFLFDVREAYAAPYTVFGQRRAALYIGAMFFVFSSSEHIRELTGHFDALIRLARVQPNETSAFIDRLAREAQ
jgi:transcriptional regulator with XRE-family HTH domain